MLGEHYIYSGFHPTSTLAQLNLLTLSQCLRMIMTIFPSYCDVLLRPVWCFVGLSACGILNHEWFWDPYLYPFPSETSLDRSVFSLLCPLRCVREFTRTILHRIYRATDHHCAYCGAVEDLYPILFSCGEFHDYRQTLFTGLRLAGRPHTTVENLRFPTGTEHQPTLTLRNVLQLYLDTGLNHPLWSYTTEDIFDVFFVFCFVFFFSLVFHFSPR